MSYSKPLPVIDELSRPFWEAARRRELMLPRCEACGVYRTYFERWCAQCGHESYVWGRLSGMGEIWSHCRFHRAYFKGFEADLPYNVALVRLEEGPLLVTNLVGAPAEGVRIGARVRATYVDVTDEVTLIKFAPA